MTDADADADLDVVALLQRLPVRQVGTLTPNESDALLVGVLRLLDIEAHATDIGGVTFGPDGTDPGDAALVQALVLILERRYGHAP